MARVVSIAAHTLPLQGKRGTTPNGLRIVDSTRQVPEALRWLQPLRHETELAGHPVAAIHGSLLPPRLSLQPFLAGAQQANATLALLSPKHPLAMQLAQAGFALLSRRHQYVLGTSAAPRLVRPVATPVVMEAAHAVDEQIMHLASLCRDGLSGAVTIQTQVLQRYLQRLATEPAAGRLLVATTIKGEVVGMLALRVRKQEAAVTLLAVAPTYRHQGVAKQLLHAATEAARHAGAPALEITVSADVRPVVQLLRRSGFAMADEQWLFRLWQAQYAHAA